MSTAPLPPVPRPPDPPGTPSWPGPSVATWPAVADHEDRVLDAIPTQRRPAVDLVAGIWPHSPDLRPLVDPALRDRPAIDLGPEVTPANCGVASDRVSIALHALSVLTADERARVLDYYADERAVA